MMEAKIQQLEAQVYALQHKQSYHPEAVEQPNLPAVAQKVMRRIRCGSLIASGRKSLVPKTLRVLPSRSLPPPNNDSWSRPMPHH